LLRPHSCTTSPGAWERAWAEPAFPGTLGAGELLPGGFLQLGTGHHRGETLGRASPSKMSTTSVAACGTDDQCLAAWPTQPSCRNSPSSRQHRQPPPFLSTGDHHHHFFS